MAELLGTYDLTTPSHRGWAVNYRIRRDDGEELHVEVRCWDKAPTAAERAGDVDALEAIANRGLNAALDYAEIVESPRGRGAATISIWFDPADEGNLRFSARERPDMKEQTRSRVGDLLEATSAALVLRHDGGAEPKAVEGGRDDAEREHLRERRLRLDAQKRTELPITRLNDGDVTLAVDSGVFQRVRNQSAFMTGVPGRPGTPRLRRRRRPPRRVRVVRGRIVNPGRSFIEPVCILLRTEPARV